VRLPRHSALNITIRSAGLRWRVEKIWVEPRADRPLSGRPVLPRNDRDERIAAIQTDPLTPGVVRQDMVLNSELTTQTGTTFTKNRFSGFGIGPPCQALSLPVDGNKYQRQNSRTSKS
jgi:hypothetical protein